MSHESEMFKVLPSQYRVCYVLYKMFEMMELTRLLTDQEHRMLMGFGDYYEDFLREQRNEEATSSVANANTG